MRRLKLRLGIRVSASIMVAYVAVFIAWVFYYPPQTPLQVITVDCARSWPYVLAIIACFLALRSSHNVRYRISWMFLSLAMIGQIVGQWAPSFAPLLDSVSLPVSLFSIGLLSLTYLTAFFGLELHAFPDRSQIFSMRAFLDALIFTVSIAGLAWHLLLGPLINADALSLVTYWNAPWIVGDLLLVFALCLTVLQWPEKRVPVPSLWLLGAFILFVIADVWQSVLTLTNSLENNLIVMPLGILCAWFVVMAGLTTVRGTANDSETEQMTVKLGWVGNIQMLIPYIFLPAVVAMLFLAYREDALLSTWNTLPALMVAVITGFLVMVRQGITLIENKRLSTSLDNLVMTLDAKVFERTRELTRRMEELATLHRVTSGLKRCAVTDDVVNVGLDLSCEAASTTRGVLWLAKPRGEAIIVAQRGLAEAQMRMIEAWKMNLDRFRKELPDSGVIVLSSDAMIQNEEELARPDSSQFCIMIVPLMVSGRAMGALGLLFDPNRACAEAETRLFRAIGIEISTALQRVKSFERVQTLADHDPLTGLFNHRAVLHELEREVKKAKKNQGSISILMMDIDDFKLFNDTHGHLAGDQALKRVAQTLVENTQDRTILGRLGGDEFLIIVTDSDQQNAIPLVERLRSLVAEQQFVVADGVKVSLKFSFGLASYPENGNDANELVEFADVNLFESKNQGGKLLISADGDDEKQTINIGTFGVLEGLITAIDLKDHYTRKHSEDVTRLVVAIARAMGLSAESQRTLRIAGLLHDIGKIAVPDYILMKPGRLDEDEFTIYKQHVLLGETIIKDVPNLAEVIVVIGAHHERFDGKGYPRGHKGAEIPLLGRILAVADVFSAMITHRPYRKALSLEDAREETLRLSGTQLDPGVVEVLLSLPLESEESLTPVP